MPYKAALALAFGLLSINPAKAEFIDWWLTPDQQGRYYYQRGEFNKAARAFTRPLWKGLAFYAAKDYASAAPLFAELDNAQGYFYLGNALARQERLAEAVDAYNKALSLQPDFEEAAFNLDWVTGLLELEQKEYEDAGGTGGKLRADKIVFDERAKNARQTTTAQEMKATQGLSDEQIQTMWMRRVQTTPGDFLRLKFSYQEQAGAAAEQEQKQKQEQQGSQ